MAFGKKTNHEKISSRAIDIHRANVYFNRRVGVSHDIAEATAVQ
jgi:hypothetical protein